MSEFLKALKEIDRTSEHKWPWQTCHICHLLTELKEDEAAGLQVVLDNKRVTNKDIADLIQDHFGYRVDPTRHRQGKCRGLK